VAVLQVPSAEQIIQLSDAGNLAAEFAEYNLLAEDGSDTFVQRYWPIVLAACHHYRLPVPPQFRRRIVARTGAE
jgi:hypothetical protein